MTAAKIRVRGIQTQIPAGRYLVGRVSTNPGDAQLIPIDELIRKFHLPIGGKIGQVLNSNGDNTVSWGSRVWAADAALGSNGNGQQVDILGGFADGTGNGGDVLIAGGDVDTAPVDGGGSVKISGGAGGDVSHSGIGGGAISLTGGEAANGTNNWGGQIVIDGGLAKGSGEGGSLVFQAGTGGATGAGGHTIITGGASNSSTTGGYIQVEGGAAVNGTGGEARLIGGGTSGSAAVGGAVTVTAGASTGSGGSTGGAVTITGGVGGSASPLNNGTGGDINLVGGTGHGTGHNGDVNITGRNVTINGVSANWIFTGTSGGIPYYSSSTTLSSSALLTNHALVVGGGAGAAPSTPVGLGTTTTVLHGNASGDPSWGAVSLTADVSGTLPAGNGGTGNAFFAVSGPASSTKTFTFPNASSTVLTSNAAVTVAQGGTGIASGTSGGVPYFSGSTTIASSAALTATALVLGGGAGAAPTTDADWKVNASHQLLGNLSGAALPTARTGTVVQLSNATAADVRIQLDGFGGAAAHAPRFTMRQARGVPGTPTATQSGDALGGVDFNGYGATDWSANDLNTGFFGFATENWTDSAQGAKLNAYATPQGSATVNQVASLAYEGCSFKGSTTNDSASAGNVGEYVSSNVSGTGTSLTTATATNLTTISLTAGDWDVSGAISFIGAAGTTISDTYAAVSTTTADTTQSDFSTCSFARHQLTYTAGTNPTETIPTLRLSLSSTTTVYLVAYCAFGVSTLKAIGIIRARRVR
jgi:hypothetical protein